MLRAHCLCTQLLIASTPVLSSLEQPGIDNITSQPWSDATAPVPPLEVLTSALSRSFCWKRQDKVLEAVLQGHVASDHGWLVILSWPVRSGGDEPGFEVIRGCVHKQRALNTRLSSGTSAGTFAVSAGPYRNYQAEAGTKNEHDTFLYHFKKRVGKSILTFRT